MCCTCACLFCSNVFFVKIEQHLWLSTTIHSDAAWRVRIVLLAWLGLRVRIPMFVLRSLSLSTTSPRSARATNTTTTGTNSRRSSSSDGSVAQCRSAWAKLTVGADVVERVVRTLGRTLHVEAKVVRVSRGRLCDPIEVHIKHRMVRGLGLCRGSGGGRVATVLLVLLVLVLVPERGWGSRGSSGGRRCTTRRELTVCVRALRRAEGVFAEHVRSLGRFCAVVVRFGCRLFLVLLIVLVVIIVIVVVVVVVIVITVTVITRASRLEITVICTRGFVVEILVIIPRRCRWRWRRCCCCSGGGGCCRCGGGGGARRRRATRRIIIFFLLYRLVVVV